MRVPKAACVDLMQRDSSAPDKPAWAGANPHVRVGVQVLVQVRRTAGTGLTEEVTGLLKHNPVRAFTLAEVLRCVRDSAIAGEVNSILHKLVFDKARVVKGRAHNGHRFVNTYRWRLPSDK